MASQAGPLADPGGEIIVRFDNLDADIALDARSDLAARAIANGTYEPELLAAIPKLLGDGDAINVGANVGAAVIVMWKAMSPGGRLLCVEPIEECVARLSSNLARVGADQGATVHRAFATDKVDGSREMWTAAGRPEYSSGGRLLHSSVVATEHLATVVPVVRLDELITKEGIRPTCIVIDCEGGQRSSGRAGDGRNTATDPHHGVRPAAPPRQRRNCRRVSQLAHRSRLSLHHPDGRAGRGGSRILRNEGGRPGITGCGRYFSSPVGLLTRVAGGPVRMNYAAENRAGEEA